MKLLSALVALLLPVLPAAAQTNPRLDPGFLPTSVYKASTGSGALQLRSRARVVAGYFTRAEGQPSAGLVRYLPSGAPDAAFNTAIGGGGFSPMTLAEAANGKLLLGCFGAGTIGGRAAGPLVQLEADGTPDPSFQLPTAGLSSFVNTVLVQADGKLVIGGDLAFLGLAPGTGIARLNANGSLDSSFQPQLTSGLLNGARGIVQQPDGKLLVVAYVIPSVSQSQNGTFQLVRLLPSGAQDTSFQPALAAGAQVGAVAIQADGQIILSSLDSRPVLAGGTTPLARVGTTGAPDATFLPPIGFSATLPTFGSTLVVQPDGRILLAVGSAPVTAGQMPVARLLPTGALDPTWNLPRLGEDFPTANTVQYLPNGQVLTAGRLLRLGAV